LFARLQPAQTLVAELAFLNAILHDKGKAVYVVPLRALASEKYKTFKEGLSTIRLLLAQEILTAQTPFLKDTTLLLQQARNLIA